MQPTIAGSVRKGIRKGHKDIFPLVETSVVEFEIRQVTELLGELDEAIAASVS